MSGSSKIEWTTHTFNPWWGCSRVSPGCVHCYADDQASRYGHKVWRRHGPRRMLSEQNWQRPLRWNRDAERAGGPVKVFCASMADVFEDHPDVAEPRKRLWNLIERTPWLTWQLLTKRPENVAGMAPWGNDWPSWVWLGVSAENQRWADTRIPILLKLPAAVRFVSAEPLIGAIDIRKWLHRADDKGTSGSIADRFRGIASRPGGPDLEGSETGRHGTSAGISASTVHGRRQTIRHRGASNRLDDGQRPIYPGGDGSQSQGWESSQQSSVEPGNCTEGLQCCSRPSPARGHVSPTDIRSEALTRAGTGSPGAMPPQGALESGNSSEIWHHRKGGPEHRDSRELARSRGGVGWLIVGGESGPGARPCDPHWLRSIVRQCRDADVPVFVKQLGSVLGRELGAGSKGGDWDAWPEDLRVREFPRAAEAVSRGA